jgi:hypothetical protein
MSLYHSPSIADDLHAYKKVKVKISLLQAVEAHARG